MTPDEYQEKAETTLVTANMHDTLAMCALGLAGESGELVDIIKKMLFHQPGKYQSSWDIEPEKYQKLQAEIGDVLWYLANLATALNISLETAMIRNIEKLQARHASGQATANGGVFNPRYQSDSVPEPKP